MGTFTNCTIHGYQLGKWGSDGGTIKNSILVNGHINGAQGGGWDVTYSVRANVGSGDIGTTFGEGDVSLSSIEDVLFIDISSGNEVNTIVIQTGSPAIDGDPNDNYSIEPSPNGGRINVGAYGNTADAQITSTPITNDISLDVNENESKTIDFSSFTNDSNINTVYSIESSTNSIVSTLSEVGGTTVVYSLI